MAIQVIYVAISIGTILWLMRDIRNLEDYIYDLEYSLFEVADAADDCPECDELDG